MSNPLKWNVEPSPPPPMFLGEKERNFTKQINDELIEKVIGKQILYFPIDYETTSFHPLYKEAIEKNFLPPIQIYAMVKYEGQTTETLKQGIDKKSKLEVYFHKRRLTEDQDLFLREGDYVKYGNFYYEIVVLNENRELFGQVDHKFQIQAICIRARDGIFNAN